MRTVKRGRPLSRDAKGNIARERLLQAGYAYFAKRPFDTVTVDEIADAAGVAHGLLFHYFGSKHGLYLEMMRNAAEQLEKIHLDPHPPIFHQRKSSLLSCADMWTLSGGARFPTS